MNTNIDRHDFFLVETEHTKLLDICEYHMLIDYTDRFNFLLWKNNGVFRIISKDQVKEALRVYEELNSAPEGQLSTAGFPCIFWDDCWFIDLRLADVLLGEEHQLYREAKKPEDGSDR